MEISKNRLLHSIGVARKMHEMTICQGLGIEKAADMFVLGFVHDIGYEFSKEQGEHANVGAEMLKNCGFKYSNEVLYHGKAQIDYMSQELYLLNTADFLIDAFGNSCTLKERLEGIEQRYGVKSFQYQEAVKLAKQLNMI